MIPGRYERIDFRAPKSQKRIEEKMRLSSVDESKIVVSIKTAKRDTREKIDGKPNKMFGKIVYETVESVDVYDATPEEVNKAVMNGLNSASRK